VIFSELKIIMKIKLDTKLLVTKFYSVTNIIHNNNKINYLYNFINSDKNMFVTKRLTLNPP